jgi:hypothetical protein
MNLIMATTAILDMEDTFLYALLILLLTGNASLVIYLSTTYDLQFAFISLVDANGIDSGFPSNSKSMFESRM